MSTNSTGKRRSRKAGKPPKPYAEFPLSPHAAGSWCKKINGKIHYFGKWGRVVDGKLQRIDGDGWREALDLYKQQVDDLKAGRKPRDPDDKRLTVGALCNAFRTDRERKKTAGEIGERIYAEYVSTTDRLGKVFGFTRAVDDLRPDDFGALRAELADQYGPVRLGNEVQRVRTVFRFGVKNRLMDREADYGTQFDKPGRAVLRKHKAASGGNMMEAAELHKLLDLADVQARAMLLLMLNCGFGPTDCATLPFSALDLDSGWINFPRPKTGIARRCPLWPETVEALRQAIAERPTPRQEGVEQLVFLTARGRRWISGHAAHPVTVVVVRLMKAAGVHRQGRGPYTMRHVFRTVADGALDRVAIDLVMGHADPSMGGLYRERVDDARLVKVAQHVRQWLFGDDGGKPEGQPELTGKAEAAPPREKEVSSERPRLRLFAG